MANNIKLLVYPVKDVAKAKEFYGKYLGVEPYAESPYYVGYKVGDMEVGLDPNTSGGGPIAYTDTKDLKGDLQAMFAAGAELVQDVKEVGPGLSVATVKDSGGNVVGFRQQS